MTRRHRIHEEEVPAVKAGLRLYLEELLEARRDLEVAILAFRALYRLELHSTGRPYYPEPTTWALIRSWLEERTLDVEEMAKDLVGLYRLGQDPPLFSEILGQARKLYDVDVRTQTRAASKAYEKLLQAFNGTITRGKARS